MTDEPGYLLDNARAEAGVRFAALSAIFDAPTFRRIDSFGIEPGWRCWEVGAGGPSRKAVARIRGDLARFRARGLRCAAELDERARDLLTST
ncbi:hypothetical protein AB0J35_14185 [Nonomuraea angiospora]|uniref:hypothetical protein n=1 Tax=Nonomuraea angiospora TaxID=46172 RepID=UPI0034146F0A